MANALFKPVTVGRYTLPNRIIMAPLTRCRSKQPGDIPWALNADYYQQRASAGLIIAEATQISPQGKGYAYTPGIYSAAQIQGWRLVTDAVHGAGGLIFLQLWHVGRISHPDLQPDGALPVAPSAIKAEGEAFTEQGFKPLVTPRALAPDEIPGIIGQYRTAASNALAAGFDGVEIHAANGYLLDQFLRDGSNHRTDAYGGCIENRARLLLEVIEAVVEVMGADKTGVRLSPINAFNSMSDSAPQQHFNYVAEQLNRFGLAYLHIVERMAAGADDDDFDFVALKNQFKGPYIANGGYDAASADAAIAAGRCDLVAFGKLFIANPDLVSRFKTGAALNTPDPDSFYGGTAQGYTDYPTLV
ncbi:MAG: alkene reductase [Gammaproteobacteria bacterium HGW-Gammaproteobacteria-3]|nr:MAG: alkene reductase [Gammaproteobacteria bacterium HGW-Gammaproteobacteria-3]